MVDEAFQARMAEYARRTREEFREAEELRERPRRWSGPSPVYSVRMPPDQLARLRRVAEERGTTPSALIRQVVVGYLDELAARSLPERDLTARVRDLEEQIEQLQAARPRLAATRRRGRRRRTAAPAGSGTGDRRVPPPPEREDA